MSQPGIAHERPHNGVTTATKRRHEQMMAATQCHWCAWCGDTLEDVRLESRVGLVCSGVCLAKVIESIPVRRRA